MRAASLLVVIVGVVPVLSSCSEAGGKEQLTVVVEADRARALADQARLADMQAALASAKQELEATRNDLQLLREKLLKAGALSADEAARLEERERSLRDREARIGTAAAAPATAGGVTREEIEALLKAQEERLRGSLAHATPAAAPAGPPSSGSADDVAAQLASVRDLRSRRGLLPDDVEGGPALERRVEDALRAKRAGEALSFARELAGKTEATVVNGAFVRRKYDRAQQRLGVLAGDKLARAKELLGDANAKNARGDHAGANEALNRVLELH
jgi:hypothetical protein